MYITPFFNKTKKIKSNTILPKVMQCYLKKKKKSFIKMVQSEGRVHISADFSIAPPLSSVKEDT